jgi:hypothetical protein
MSPVRNLIKTSSVYALPSAENAQPADMGAAGVQIVHK